MGNAIGESLAQPSYRTLQDTGPVVERIQREQIGTITPTATPDFDIERGMPLGSGGGAAPLGAEGRAVLAPVLVTGKRASAPVADSPVIDVFLTTQRIDSRLIAATPSGMRKLDGSPVTYSFNLSTKQAYWNLGEDNLLREIPRAYKQPGIDEAARADPNNPFALAGHAGDILTDFALTSAFGTASVFTGGAAYGGLMRLGLGARSAMVTSSMIGDATFQTMQMGANSLSDGRYGVQDFSGIELAVAGALPIALGGRAAITELAGELRGMGLPDWNIRLAQYRPGLLRSNPLPLEAERIGDVEGAGSTFKPYSGDPMAPDFVGPLPNTPTSFVNGVVVLDQRTGLVYAGTVDLQPTLDRIENGIPYPHRNDGSVFQNRPPIGGNGQPLLPAQTPGYYKEYVVPTPGVNGPGPQRIVVAGNGEMYYTPDPYGTFVPIKH